MAGDQRYVALDSRRGMNYHRLRPQSVPHALPKGGVSRASDGFITIDLPGPVLDPEADADRVYELLIEAVEAVRQTMVAIGMTWLRLRGRLVFGITNRRHDRLLHAPGRRADQVGHDGCHFG